MYDSASMPTRMSDSGENTMVPNEVIQSPAI